MEAWVHAQVTSVEHEILCHTSNHWATGIVSKSLKKYMETIPGQHSIDSLQKPLYKEPHTS
jgi:hypothetical protein